MGRAPHQRGVSLVDALVACLVLSLGMLGLARFQARLQCDAELARQRSQAVRLAQRQLEGLRDPTHPATAAADDSDYRVTSHSTPADGPATLVTLAIRVDWTDRGGEPHHVVLESALADMPPALSAALVLPRGSPPPGWPTIAR